MSLLYTGSFLWKKKLIITKLIAQFTVTGGNEVKVELVLKQPFLFWYVYYFVLILTSIFKQNNTFEKDGALYQNKVNFSHQLVLCTNYAQPHVHTKASTLSLQL